MKLNINQLNPYFLRVNKINSVNQKVFILEPLELLTVKRIDIIAKLLFIEYLKDETLSFFKDIYYEHLKCLGLGKIYEGDGSKSSYADFESNFKNLYDNFRENGFDYLKSVIPINDQNIILDGAHRTSLAIYYNRKIPVSRFIGLDATYNYQFFRDRLYDESKLDFIIMKFAQIKKSIGAVILWPQVCNNELSNLLEQYRQGQLYEKNIRFTSNGLQNFVTQVYQNEEWVGNSENQYKGALIYANQLAGNLNNLEIKLLLYDTDLSDILELKSSIRTQLNIGNLSAHSTDTYNECVMICELLLNNNSIHHLNNSNLKKNKTNHETIMNFKRLLIENDLDKEKVVIDSSFVLSLYGLREANDLDFITTLEESSVKALNESYDNHIMQFNEYDISINELVMDPNNYLYFSGLKFMSLSALSRFKGFRGEGKDLDDIKLISSLTNKKTIRWNLIRLMILVKRIIHYRYIQFRSIIVKLLKTLGLYDFAKTIHVVLTRRMR